MTQCGSTEENKEPKRTHQALLLSILTYFRGVWMPCPKPSCQLYFFKRSYFPQYVTPGAQKLGAHSLPPPPFRKAGMARIVVSGRKEQYLLFPWEFWGHLKPTRHLSNGGELKSPLRPHFLFSQLSDTLESVNQPPESQQSHVNQYNPSALFSRQESARPNRGNGA